MKPLYKHSEFNKQVTSGEVTIFYDKRGLEAINEESAIWNPIEGNPNILANRQDEQQLVTPEPHFKIGQQLEWTAGILIEITGVELTRLELITEEDALKAGVVRLEEGYAHHCPELMFPRKILKRQPKGYPFVKSAKTSYQTRHLSRYGFIDTAINPFLFKYNFKYVGYE